MTLLSWASSPNRPAVSYPTPISNSLRASEAGTSTVLLNGWSALFEFSQLCSESEEIVSFFEDVLKDVQRADADLCVVAEGHPIEGVIGGEIDNLKFDRVFGA